MRGLEVFEDEFSNLDVIWARVKEVNQSLDCLAFTDFNIEASY